MYFGRALLFELVKRMLKSVNKNQRYCKIKVEVFWNKAYMQKYGNNRHQFVLTKCRWQMTTSDFECNSANMRTHIVKCTSTSLTVVYALQCQSISSLCSCLCSSSALHQDSGMVAAGTMVQML